MIIGEKIREIRQSQGITAGTLSEIAGVSKSYLSQLENGKSQSPSVEIVAKIAEALDVSILEILDKKVEKICENCRYWDSERCKRFPPQFTGGREIVMGMDDNYRDITENQVTWAFPEVSKDDWCGEWKPKG